MEYLKKRSGHPDLNITSLPQFNKGIWGIERKKLTIIGGRPSNLKSTLALQIANDIAKEHGVLFLSLEMSIDEVSKRLFCNLERVANTKLDEFGISAHIENWHSFEKTMLSSRLVVDEHIGQGWKAIQAFLEELNPKPALLIMDYIQCISQFGLKKLEVIDEYIKMLREMAIRHDMAVVVLSQINRGGIDKEAHEPSLTGLKSSGFLEEHADKVLLLHWPYHYDNSEPMEKFKITVAKNKSGKTGSYWIKVIPSEYRFEEMLISSETKKVVDMFGAQKVDHWNEEEQ